MVNSFIRHPLIDILKSDIIHLYKLVYLASPVNFSDYSSSSSCLKASWYSPNLVSSLMGSHIVPSKSRCLFVNMLYVNDADYNSLVYIAQKPGAWNLKNGRVRSIIHVATCLLLFGIFFKFSPQVVSTGLALISKIGIQSIWLYFSFQWPEQGIKQTLKMNLFKWL